MVNAWSLLYSQMNGTIDEDYPTMNKKEDEEVTILGGEEDNSRVSAELPTGNVYAADTVSFDYNWWGDDGFSITGNPTASSDTLNLGYSHLPGGMGNDHISFVGGGNTAYDDNKYYADGYDPYPSLGGVDSLDLKPKPNLKGSSNHKYQEDKGISDLKDYVSSTYQGHYTNDGSNVQTLDLIHSVGDAESFCRSNAIKYLSRYDKKGQAKRDILKAMHYCLLLYYFSGQTNDEITTRGYETF
jgi:hypothetical protein